MPAAVRPALLLVLLLAAGSLAAEVYRYTDSRGGVVLDRQGVPPEQVAKGYAVLDEQGRVIREVPPAPSAEELRRRAEAQRQAAADEQLRRRYPSLADLDVACASQLRDLDGFLAVTRDKLQLLRKRLRGVERQAAEQQRGGQPVPAPLLEQREGLQREQQLAKAELRRLQGLRQSTEAGFAAERQRLAAILAR